MKKTHNAIDIPVSAIIFLHNLVPLILLCFILENNKRNWFLFNIYSFFPSIKCDNILKYLSRKGDFNFDINELRPTHPKAYIVWETEIKMYYEFSKLLFSTPRYQGCQCDYIDSHYSNQYNHINSTMNP